MNPVGTYIGWEGVLQVDFPRGTLWDGDSGLVRQHKPHYMPQMAWILMAILFHIVSRQIKLLSHIAYQL